ncbi:MAG: hypothetical protein NWS46_03250 [Cyclobacteriaceae bacterium]|jgi:hypothetical protein|nr:hypothetical protein [Cyclobacteriaceae bacterium]
MGLATRGMYNPDQSHWGGWSGRFSKKKIDNFWSRHEDIKVDEERVAPFKVYSEASDRWVNKETGEVYDNDFVPVWRWRRAMYNDYKCRIWCIATFEEANHHPIAGLD